MSGKSHFILSDADIDRWVRRSLRKLPGAPIAELQRELRRRMIEVGIITSFQLPPDDDDVYRSLQRQTLSGRVVKYIYETKDVDRAIRYRVSEK
jgi:hypothetical protein